jgi:AcrR family transcriptional regulator
MWFMAVQGEDGRRTRHRQRKADLIAAATDYVLENGLADLSLRPLAAALGISHRTLLYHFGSKERLFAEIVKEARIRERLAVAARGAREDMTPSDRLRAAWEHFASPEMAPFVRFHFQVHALALQGSEIFRDVWVAGDAEWLETIERLMVRQGFPPERAGAMATLILATFRGFQLDLSVSGERERVNAAFEQFVAMVENSRAAELARP